MNAGRPLCPAGVFHFRRTPTLCLLKLKSPPTRPTHSTVPVHAAKPVNNLLPQNNLRHGFAGKFKVLDWEDQTEFEMLLSTFGAEHEPASPYEFVLVEKMAQHFWLAQRSLNLQEQCFRPDLPMKEADAKLSLYCATKPPTTAPSAKPPTNCESSETINARPKLGSNRKNRKKPRNCASRRSTKPRFASPMPKQCTSKSIATSAKPSKRPLPGNMRMPFDTLKKVFSSAVAQVNRDLKAAEAA